MREEPNRRKVFVGIDLAWAVERRHTGIALMEGNLRGVRLSGLSSDIHSLEGVTQFVCQHLCSNMVVAVDASLIVRNEAGQRPCERAIGAHFGRFGASCHSTNRARPHFDSGERLVSSLAREGFDHGLPLRAAKRRPGRWLIEVYPHPAMVRLFGLERIIAYKKGPIDERRAGLRRVQSSLRRLVTRDSGIHSSACLERLLRARPEALRGRALKCLEDLLDAVLCAYLAWHFWRWGEERNEVFGDRQTGYIVVPSARPGC
jgi:predicted RNase H-like nuclease